MTHATLNNLLTTWNIDIHHLQQQKDKYKTLKTQSKQKKDINDTGIILAIFIPVATTYLYIAFNAGYTDKIEFTLRVILILLILLQCSAILSIPAIKYIKPYGARDAQMAKTIKIQNQKSMSIHHPTFKTLYEQYHANLALVRTTYARNPTKFPNLLEILNKCHDKEPTLDSLLNNNINAILRQLNNQPQFVQLQSFVDSHPEMFNTSA